MGCQTLKNIYPMQSRCRQVSAMTMHAHWNFKLSIKMDICIDFKQILKKSSRICLSTFKMLLNLKFGSKFEKLLLFEI